MRSPNIMSFLFEDPEGEEETYYIVNPEWDQGEPVTWEHPGYSGYAVWDKVTHNADGSGEDLTHNVEGTWAAQLFAKTSDTIETAFN